jgi:TonB family protein
MRILIAAGATIFTLTTVIYSQTPQRTELSKVVETARLLEEDPLGKGSKRATEWFNDWLKQTTLRRMPDCSGFFEVEGENEYSHQLSLQFKISSAAFMIEHEQEALVPNARMLAGIVGMVKAYTRILQTNPKIRSPFLDSVVAMQNNNEITKHLREIMAQCSDVPLSDKNLQLGPGDLVYGSLEVEELPRVARLPFPEYVESARRSGTTGKVILRAVLAATGKVARVEVIKGLPNGLTQSSVRAAQAITFEPAQIGGKPVSVILRLEYTFMKG